MEYKIDREHHQTEIVDYLRHLHSFSRRMITAIKFDGGEISVNGESKNVRYRLQAGDRLTIKWPLEKIGENLTAESLPLEIIYEDDAVLILNKPAGVAVVPSPNHKTGSMANRILGYYVEQNIPYTVHIVTRLDRDTSGLLLVAKHRYSHSLLAKSQEDGNIQRKYKAIIQGSLKNKQGLIDAPIARKEGSIIERTVHISGKTALTEYIAEKETKTHTLVDVLLRTGRTHQIRVHFSHIGHPLAGDDLYGGSRKQISRQALHCSKLIFQHPLTKEQMAFELSLPKDMENLLKKTHRTDY